MDMKKIVFTIVMMAVLCPALRGQNPARVSTDTLPCGVRMPNYWYSDWYDTTPWYLYGSARDSIHVYNDGRDTYYFHWHPGRVGLDGVCNEQGFPCDLTTVFEQYAPTPIRVKGLWVMLSQYAGDMMYQNNGGNIYPVLDSTRLPEDLYLYVPRAGAENTSTLYYLDRVATVRWDTAHPKMMCLQKTLDSTFAGVNDYCHVYEALFDTVYTVEGEFWIGGSQRSNTLSLSLGRHEWFGHLHFPTLYLTFGECFDRWNNPHANKMSGNSPDGPFYIHGPHSAPRFGPFGVITDGQRYVEVSTSDTAQGLGLYTAFYPDSTYQTITAVPNRGFRFSRWNDSVTDNPRTVFVTSDTSFMAYFDSLPEYRVGVESGDGELGHVTGGGLYYEGETARVEGVAHEGSRFVGWDDGVGENPRALVVTSDTVLTAVFEPIPRYEVGVESNDHGLGYVTGGGTYYEGEEAVVEAVAHEGNRFEMWDDSVRENPRRIVVVQDTAFTAIFRSGLEGVVTVAAVSQFRLVPNPASGEVRFEAYGGDFGGGVLTVRDASGREVLRRELAAGTQKVALSVADYPSGTYFVTLTTKEGIGTQKLVVE
jgi:hypothetical protein